MKKYVFEAIVNKKMHEEEVYADNLNHAREEAGWKLARKLNISTSDISKLKEKNEKTIGIFNFITGLHKAKYLKSQWYYYLFPRRLTLITNPPCYKWMFWYIAPRKTEYNYYNRRDTYV